MNEERQKRFDELMDQLSPQRRLFIREYLANGGNGAQAALKAGVGQSGKAKLRDEKTLLLRCAETANKFLKESEVQSVLALASADALEEMEINAAWWVKKAKRMVDFNMEIVTNEYGEVMRNANAACRALEMLGKTTQLSVFNKTAGESTVEELIKSVLDSIDGSSKGVGDE